MDAPIHISSGGKGFWIVVMLGEVFTREGGFDEVLDWAQRKLQ